MNFVFLSPHFPPNWYRFAAGLRQAGATVLGVADVNHEQLAQPLRDALHDYYRVDDLGSYDQLVRAMGWFISRHGRIDRIDSLNEHWLETEAALRSDFNVAGLNRRTIGAVKRKSLMKSRFASAGLQPARGRICRTPAALRAFAAEVGYPLVAKPDVGVGAARTYKLAGAADLERFWRDKLPVDYIVEEFVAGDLLTYDGLVDRDGEVVFDSTFTYSTGVMESVNEGSELSYWMPRAIPADVGEMGRAMARAFDLRERPFHFEMFRTADGRLVPLEVNMRPPGGFTVDMFNWCNDLDFYREWANVVVKGRFEAPVTRRYACLYVGRRDSRRYALSHAEVMHEFGSRIVYETRMPAVLAPAMGDHAYILRDPDLELLMQASRAIHRLAED